MEVKSCVTISMLQAHIEIGLHHSERAVWSSNKLNKLRCKIIKHYLARRHYRLNVELRDKY